jgi:hypothetical protein
MRITIPGASMTAAHPVLDLEARRVAAMVAQDIPTLEALLADDLLYTHSRGTSDTKASFLALIRGETDHPPYLAVDFSDRQVIAWGEDSVLVRGRADISLQGKATYGVRFVDVWARRGGRWQLVAWQATRIPD